VAALLALVQMPAHDLSATATDGSEGAPVAGRHTVAELGQVVVAVRGDDVGELDHGSISDMMPSRVPCNLTAILLVMCV